VKGIRCTILTAALLAPAPAALHAAEATPLYKIVASIPLGSPERWDYATYDAASKRVYVAHGDHLTVVDAAKNAVAGQVGTFPGGTHGSAVAEGTHVAYTDDGKAGIAAAFDPTTLRVVKQIPAAPDADGIVYDSASRHVFVIDGDSGVITVIDPQANATITTIKTNTVIAHYPLTGCERPHGIAVDADSRRVFVTCINKVMVVVDADKGANLASLPIGASSDGAAFDPRRKYALSSNGEGTLSVIKEVDANHFVKLGDVPTQRSARTIAIDPASGRIYLPAADIAKVEPPDAPGRRPRTPYVANSLKLLVLEPTR
jgi:DNA-binding beta-propeller fold protein YncE